MVLVLIWGHNTAAVSSIVMNLRSRQPNMWRNFSVVRVTRSIPCSCQRRHSTFYIGEAYHQHYYEKTGFKKYEVLAAKFKLIIHCCQFCRIFSQNWQKLFTPNLQTGLARNLLLHRVKAEAERARGTTRTLSNDSWGFLEILEPRKPKQSLLKRIN